MSRGIRPAPEPDIPMPLTDAAIRRAKPADKPEKLADGGGLFLLIAVAGAKS